MPIRVAGGVVQKLVYVLWQFAASRLAVHNNSARSFKNGAGGGLQLAVIRMGSGARLGFEKQMQILPLHCVQGRNDSAWESNLGDGGVVAGSPASVTFEGFWPRNSQFAPMVRHRVAAKHFIRHTDARSNLGYGTVKASSA